MSGGLTVGVVGGGQLARMLHQAAISLGVTVVVLDPDPTCSAVLAGAGRFDGTWSSLDDLLAFSRSGVDVITFDHELARPEDLAALERSSPVPLHPSPRTKRLAQDKLIARERLRAQGVPVPAYAAIETLDDVLGFADEHGWPLVLKARRGGYDGRGVWIVGDDGEARAVLAETRDGAGLLAEELVDIAQELAVMVARRPNGETRAWAPLHTTQVDGICTEVVLGSSSTLDEEARSLVVELADRIDLTGVMAVELFVTRARELLVNELACRPHNSGHVTMDSCVTDQFEQHLRAVLDLPLGSVQPVVPAAVMVNVLGGPAAWTRAGLAEALAVECATLHVYGKDHRPGRKLGHVTAVGQSASEARDRARRAAAALGSPV